MNRRRRITLLVLLGILAACILFWRLKPLRPVTITGVVITQDIDPSKQSPIADVDVTASDGIGFESTKSDSSGLFRLTLHPRIGPSQLVTVQFEHPGYERVLLTEAAGERLWVVRMLPLPEAVRPAIGVPLVRITNVTVRYTLRTVNTASIGSAVKTFEVINTKDVPCGAKAPCSPDGKWKATVASVSLDAGEGNEFRRPRVSCIAGPCPFTKVDSDKSSDDGRTLTASVRDWSAPATFLMQAEVVRKMSENMVLSLYPVIFGRELNFILPAEAEGPSIEADVNGAAIVFPLGPDLCLTWADCHLRSEKDQTKVYRCELKPGYQFR